MCSRVGRSQIGGSRFLQFAKLAGAKHLVPFHHDPSHKDSTLDAVIAEAVERAGPAFEVSAAREGGVLEVG